MSNQSKAFVEAKKIVVESAKTSSMSPHSLVDLAIREALRAAEKYQRTPEEVVESSKAAIMQAMKPILERNKELEELLISQNQSSAKWLDFSAYPVEQDILAFHTDSAEIVSIIKLKDGRWVKSGTHHEINTLSFSHWTHMPRIA